MPCFLLMKKRVCSITVSISASSDTITPPSNMCDTILDADIYSASMEYIDVMDHICMTIRH